MLAKVAFFPFLDTKYRLIDFEKLKHDSRPCWLEPKIHHIPNIN